MKPYLQTDRVTLYHGRAEDVYPHLEPGFTLAVLDGPYGVSIAEWDKMGIDGLADWYRPHLEAITALMAPSASLYLWNTAEGWARLDPEVRRLGWGFRGLIVWDKLNTACSMAWEKMERWPVTHEVCGFYARGEPTFSPVFPRSVWTLAVQGWADERLLSGATRKGAKNQDGVSCTVKEALHPTQKPLLFADRIIRASSRPGDRVLSVFSGTCREAVACHRLPPDEARHCVSIEMDVRYLDAVRRCFVLDTRPSHPGQVGLFG